MARLLLALALAFLVAVPAADATTARRVGPILGPLASDGQHTVGYTPAAGQFTVIHADGDTVDGTVPAACAFVDVSRSTVLFACPPAHPDEGQGPHVPVLLDSETGEFSQPAGVEPAFVERPDRAPAHVTALGTRWIQGYADSNMSHVPNTPIMLTRGTPATLHPFAGRQPAILDLDRVSGYRPLCAPLRVPMASPGGSIEESWPLSMTYSKPWMLVQLPSGRSILGHCGTRRTQRLACTGCTGFALNGPWLAWRAGGHLVVRDLRTDRIRRWRVPAGSSFPTLTRESAFTIVPPPSSSSGVPASGPGTLYRADLR